MTFSLRTSLIVISVLAGWLGALVSKSPLLVELVASTTALLIFVTLPFAIWDTRPDQRAFWTGFFVLALGNLLIAKYLSAYELTGSEVASRILGEHNVAPPNPYMGPPMLTPGRNISFYQPAPMVNPTNPSFIQLPANPNDYYQQHNAISTAVPYLISLIVGVIGGYLTLWISRQARRTTETTSVGQV